MMRQTMICGALAIAVALVVQPLDAASQIDADPTARAILDRWARAAGGVERLRRLENVYTKADYRGTAGTGTVEEWTTARGQRRQSNDLSTGLEVSVFDGARGWSSEGGRVRELSPDEAAAARTPAYFGSYSHLVPGRLPGRVEYMGEDPSGGEVVLRVTPRDGRPSTVYVSKQTHLPIRHEQQLAFVMLTVRFQAWRTEKGIKVPARLHLTTSDGGYEAIETVRQVRFNVPADPGAFAKPAEGPRDVHFAAGHSALGIPLEEENGHVFVQGHLNGSGPMWFGLDTAASGSLLDAGRARTLGLPPQGRQRITGVGGSVEGGYATGVDVRLPGVEMRRQTFSTLPLDFLSSLQGREMPVILGYDFFSRFVVEIDYSGRSMNLHDPERFEYRGQGTVVPITIHGNQPYVSVRLRLEGRDPLEGEYVVDTGSGQSLMVARQYADEHDVRASLLRTIQARAQGVGGATTLTVGRARGLEIGPFAIAGPIVLLPAGEITAPGKAGNIGGRLLRRFRVIFDYSRGRMILEPNARFSDPEDYDMSGASLAAEGQSFTLIRVTRVLERSPAAEVGLRPGDEIVSVDGEPAARLGLSRLREMFAREGREYDLLLKRGERTVRVRLKPRRSV